MVKSTAKEVAKELRTLADWGHEIGNELAREAADLLDPPNAVDKIALEAVRKIRALPPKAGIQWDAQHTARVQCIVADAIREASGN